MWEQIRSNRRRSAVLMVLMGALLAVGGFAIGSILGRGEGGGPGLALALVVWVVLALVAFFQGDRVYLSLAGAREIQREHHPQLFNVVEEMTIAAGLPKPPRVFLIDDPAPNAFATGRDEATAAVAVTTGLLTLLDRDELQGVIGHEIGHIRNRDILLLLFLGLTVGLLVILADLAGRVMTSPGLRRTAGSRKGGGAVVVILAVCLVLIVLAPLGRLLYLACSRRREFLADASSALFTRYPEGLASALEKLSGRNLPKLAAAGQATAPLFIVNPLNAAGDGESLLSTHPPLSERIRVLRAMGQSSLCEYERCWEALKGKRLMRPETTAVGPAAGIRKPEPTGVVEEPLKRARAATDALWRLNGYAFRPCVCGATLKIPPGTAGALDCPRCGKPVGI